ncbi:YhgE/Pip domain-containing protein [Clostridium sp. A1-XYC3]|uniref:YhgE/Pip domain-containing protein n=1 Tax=Clostridium tanneri TaxID=3037988 RepID=A0ABU4JRR0_9CLOT|nr:YhgE/Pip domain-containing protein [Clostridium sp. A1-XYC3]MDW8800829.1 YhgE/Pip domain-containing protein [Clostridium sp. A1-XYC3]
MKNILKIYRRDFKNIITNWVALVVVIALMILPALYAWFNIKSAWDPYGNTAGILVAVVNKDKGAQFSGQKLDVGKQVLEKLKTNTSIGWRFVDEKTAEEGVKYGKYYASITIPENFSKRLLTVVESEPQKADLIYKVNEKRNAVAPKITQKGATSLQEQLNSTFVKTVNGIIFDIFNRLGIELEEGKPVLQSFINIIFEIDNRIPQINKAVDDLYNGVVTLQGFVRRVQSDLPIVEDTIDKASNVVNTGESFLVKVRDSLKNAAPLIKENLVTLDNAAHIAEDEINDAADLAASNPSRAKELLSVVRDRYNRIIKDTNVLLDFLKSLGNASDNKVIKGSINSLTNLRDRIQGHVNNINFLISSIDRGEQVTADILSTLKKDSAAITKFLDSEVSNFDTVTAPAVNSVMENSIAVADNTLKLLADAKNDLPVVSELLKKVNTGTELGLQDITELKGRLPATMDAIHTTAERLRALNDDDKLNEIIRILRLDARKESEFIASPINLIQDRMFPIPNYGSAMSPFFTSLSLWVGCLILVSILSVEVPDLEEGKRLKPQEIYLGRYLTFLTIAIFQALVVTIGDIYLLKTYVANPTIFIIYAVYISIVFSMIVYTLVSVFGNVGKALAMILLVLQISSSGGTFPIEVTPAFFQHLNPFIPFTYAVGGMREAVGGVLWDLLGYNAAILGIYFFIFIIIGIAWKELLSGIITKFVEKFKESGLVGE